MDTRANSRISAKSLWLFIFTVLTGASVSAHPAKLVPIGTGHVDASFVFSDLDGDQRLDFAFVQAGHSDLHLTEYWVHLRLSCIGAHEFCVVAPLGGLKIASRDINGDQMPDLILATNWGNKPVAVFLNDGHGRFSAADSSIYSEASSASSASWTVFSSPEYKQLIVPSESRTVVCLVGLRLRAIDSSCGDAHQLEKALFCSHDLGAHLGRAPPCNSHSF